MSAHELCSPLSIDQVLVRRRILTRIDDWDWQQGEHIVNEDHPVVKPYLHLPPVELGMKIAGILLTAQVNYLGFEL